MMPDIIRGGDSPQVQFTAVFHSIWIIWIQPALCRWEKQNKSVVHHYISMMLWQLPSKLTALSSMQWEWLKTYDMICKWEKIKPNSAVRSAVPYNSNSKSPMTWPTNCPLQPPHCPLDSLFMTSRHMIDKIISCIINGVIGLIWSW